MTSYTGEKTQSSSVSDGTMNSHTNGGTISSFYKLQHKKRVHQAEIIVDYILQQMEDPQVSTDPLGKVSCLYTFKALFEKSPRPRSMVLCFERGFLSTLAEILEREFIPLDKNNEVMLYQLAMEILWLFSRVDAEQPKTLSKLPLLAESLVTLVSRYTDVNCRFFQFSPCFSKALYSLCRDVHFQQQSIRTLPMSQLIWDDITFYQPWMAKYGTIPCLLQCSLNFQPKGKKHVKSVASQLIDNGLAWSEVPESPPKEQPIRESVADLLNICRLKPPAERSPQEDEEQGDNTCEDVVFLNTIGGHYFWAYIGSTAVNTVEYVSEVLHAELPTLKTFKPQVGNVVVVVERENVSIPSVMRGRVIEVGEDNVTVLALDYGVVKKVKAQCVYELSGAAVQLASIEPQAKVCCLAGVHPPPANEPTVELALAFLTNLSKNYNDAVFLGFHFHEAGGIDNLGKLVQTAPPSIRLQSLRLLANLSSISRLTKAVDWTPLIRPLLETLVKMSKNQEGDSMHRNTLVASLYALTNIMYCKPKYKDTFFELNGQFIVLNVIRLYKCSFPIVKAATGMLRTVFSGLMKTIPKNLDNVTCDTTMTSELSEESEDERDACPKQNGKASEKSSLQDTSRQTVEESSDEEMNEMMARLMPRQYLKQEAMKLRALEEDDKRSDELHKAETKKTEASEGKTVIERDRSSNSSCSDMLEVCHTERETEAGEPTDTSISLFQQHVELSSTSDFIPVDGKSVEQAYSNYYEFNTCVPFREGMTHHILDVQSMNSITADHLTELITGMLNSEGGTIHIGLTKQGSVRGLRVNRLDREFLRLAVDEVMARTNPVIPHILIDLDYVTILRRAGTGVLEVYQDVFVVEIHIKPPIDKVYYTVEKGRVCFQRFEAETYQLTEQDVREMVVMEEERQYLPVICSLEERLRQLQQEPLS